METAFVLVSCEAGTTGTVTKKIQMIYEIKEVTPVWGAYDIVVKVVGSTSDAVREIITGKIRMIDGIKITYSLIVSR